MSKKAKFQMIGSVVNHPDYPEGLERGDVLTLEVGDDGKPTSELFQTRTVPVGREVDSGDGMSEADAKGKAKEIIADAKAKAKEILDKAKDDAAGITQKATEEAAELIAAAGGSAQ